MTKATDQRLVTKEYTDARFKALIQRTEVLKVAQDNFSKKINRIITKLLMNEQKTISVDEKMHLEVRNIETKLDYKFEKLRGSIFVAMLAITAMQCAIIVALLITIFKK